MELMGFRWAAFVRPGTFTTRVGFNGLAQIAPMVVSLALTPLLTTRLGADRLGVWSLIILSTLTSLDVGVSASLARFFAVHAAHEDRAGAGRLLLGSLLFFVGFGLGLALAVFGLAPTLVGFLHVPADLESEAVWALRWLPLLAIVALAADAMAATLAGELAILRTGVEGFPGLVITGLPPLIALTIVAPLERRRSRSREAPLQRATSV